ncbi:prophage tail fiber N-terminal domain-containing protein [Vibrio metschnikovii]|uniref:prophage tail fiber N-terminal domain-containing protein n=1 Tax=Vibrio metschnikovii TaxID=28172 RepID=UPI002FCA5775|nr:prophage tail fiber N-terminal domain-containing protein [Vibrio metschnikovii]
MITLKGILTDAGGNPIPRGLIELVAKRNAGEALVHAAISERANEEGEYHFTIKSGEYLVYAQVSRQSDVEPLGEAIISYSLGDEITLEEALAMSEPLAPESIIEMRQILQSVRQSESQTSDLANQVIKSTEEVTAFAQQVSEMSNQVSHQHDEVLKLSQDVLPKLEAANELSQGAVAAAELVEQQAQDVSAKHDDVSQWYPEIKDKHSAVIEAKRSVDESESNIVGLEKSAAESSFAAQQAAQTATQKAEQTAQDALATSQDRTAVSELAQQVSLNAQSASEDKLLAQQAAQAATQKAEQTEQDALATSQDRTAVSEAKLSVDASAQLVSEKSMLVEQLSSQTEQNAQVATEQATIATVQAKRAENLVDAATGGSLLKEANLSDLDDVDEARSNLKAASIDDERFSDEREWKAETVEKEEAELGESNERKAWSSLRVRQAIKAFFDTVKTAFITKDANLSDLESPTEARKNLSVYSQQQVDNRLEKKVGNDIKINGKPLTNDISITKEDLGIEDDSSSEESLRRLKLNALLGETIYFK